MHVKPLGALALALSLGLTSRAAAPNLLFHASFEQGTTADTAAPGTATPTYEAEVKPIGDGAKGHALECGDYQLLAYRAPGNVYAQRGTLSFYWRSRYPVGPTAFPIFRIGYADHSSWDMVFLRVDYNGHGFDAFVTDASLTRWRTSVSLDPFPGPKAWTHLAVSWDETRGIRLYVNGNPVSFFGASGRLDAALDQFGPHSRIISPHQVQSDYNFVRGGDIDELRIYDRMLSDTEVAALSPTDTHDRTPAAMRVEQGEPNPKDVRAAWDRRYGWDAAVPPALPEGKTVSIRKVEIHDAYDLKRWWWKANDGIRETTWPGVYNRSRLPGRHDYFELPDWDCYVDSGKAVTFALPAEPWNHLEISGAAWGRVDLLPANTDLEHAYQAQAERKLFDREKGHEHTAVRLAQPMTGRSVRFTNIEQEQPIGEFSAYNVTAAAEPAGTRKLAFTLSPAVRGASAESLRPIESYIDGRFPAGERGRLVAGTGAPPTTSAATAAHQPIAHILVPDTWDALADGLDGIALDLPALNVRPTHSGRIALNLQVHDPLWPLRTMLDFTFSVTPGEARTLWLDLRDRMLPAGKPLWVTVACSSPEFSEQSLAGAELRLVFKSREAARAEHEIDRFTQVRDVYAMMTEEHPANPRLDMWNRFKADLDDLLRVNPEHELGRQYAAVGANAARPPFKQPEPPAGVPLWAFRQVTLLGQVMHFATWYVDHRQVEYGDFGGGISDDVDLLNTWPGVALMGGEPTKLKNSVAKLLDAAYRNGMFANGLPAIQTDELHSYEEGINCLGQNLILNFGSPRQIERAMETARGVQSITGVNAAGHRHIRSSYYSGTKMAEEDPWGYAKPYSYLVLQVPQLLVEFNGNPVAKQYLLELADGLLAHHRPQNGRRGASVPAIHFVDDKESDVGRGAFPWHVFWAAYEFTGDRRFLQPVFDGGITSLAVLNPNVLDRLGLRADWGQRLDSGERAAPVEGRRDTGRTRERTGSYRSSNTGHFAWQLSGDKSNLEKLYAEQIETCALLDYINTEGSLWIDRVGVPTAELQRARLGGVALVRNAVLPGHVISWQFAAPANDQSVAILVPNATATEFKVIAYNLETTPVRATMTGWNIDPGIWEISQGVDANGDDTADGETVKREDVFERSSSLDVTFAPRATTILSLKLKTRRPAYWERPDVGIDPQDVVVHGNAISVRVHSLGSVAMPASKLSMRDAAGKIIAEANVATIEAPIDLHPRATEVSVTLPSGTQVTGCTVELNADNAVTEITQLNNRVKL